MRHKSERERHSHGEIEIDVCESGREHGEECVYVCVRESGHEPRIRARCKMQVRGSVSKRDQEIPRFRDSRTKT